MTKRRWNELMQALYENHFDPRKDEELKQSKLDIENILPRILKLIKERRSNRRNRNVEANLRKESELVELIEDFHKQYQFVYGQYDNIRGQLSQTVHVAKEDEGYFTATSSSDSDTETEKDVTATEKESENIMQELKEKLKEQRREVSSIVEIQKHCQREVSGLMKELKSEFLSLNRKLGGMQPEKMVSEQQVENRQLQDQASKLEEIAKEMNEAVSQVLKNGVEGVTEEEVLVLNMSNLNGLILQVNHLKLNMECLINNAQKTDCEQQKMGQGSKNGYAVHENLMDQVNKMKRDLGFMRKKNTELESNIKKQAQENSGFLSQIDDLKKEVASKTHELQKIQKEREDSVVRMKKLELEADNLSSQRNEREKLMARKEQENVKLTQEIEELIGKMVKMEKMLKEREEQFITLQKKLERGEDEKSAQINHIEQELESKNELEKQIRVKNNDISRLTEEKKSLQGRIFELEKKLQDERDEFSKLQNDMSTQKEAMTKVVSQLQQEQGMERKLNKQISSHDKEINKLGEEKGSLEEKVLELEDEIADLQRTSQVGENEVSYLQGELSVERRKFSERLNELETRNNELSFKVSDQEFMIKQHEDTIKKLKEDCKLMKGRFLQATERKIDEVAEEFRKNFEDNMRILSRRIKVAEQLHVETKESWKRTQEDCELQHPGLKKKLAQMMVSSTGKTELITVSQGVDEMMKGMEDLIGNFESKENGFLQRLSKVNNEIQVAKNWVQWTMDGIKPWKTEPPQGSVLTPIMDDNEQDKMMKEKVRRLEAKVNKEKSDKLRLMRVMYDMQKKVAELENEVVIKDEGLLRLGEEKVEAIRQLCMWVDYQQYRFDQLKEAVLVKKTKRGSA